jgi:hypothetical protein
MYLQLRKRKSRLRYLFFSTPSLPTKIHSMAFANISQRYYKAATAKSKVLCRRPHQPSVISSYLNIDYPAFTKYTQPIPFECSLEPLYNLAASDLPNSSPFDSRPNIAGDNTVIIEIHCHSCPSGALPPGM